MKCEYVLVLVRKDLVQETPVTVFPHEIQILYAIHGESNITVVDPYLDVAAVNLEPDEEYARLERRYGVDAEQNSTSFVELVYGKPFLKNLDKEMELGKSRIVDEEDEPDLESTDLSTADGMKVRLKQVGGTFPPAVKKKELVQILRHELITGIEEAGADKPGKTISLPALSDLYDEVTEAA